MSSDWFLLLGGVGMFLLGMDTLTRALKEVAGARLRAILARFTTTPFRGVLTGAAATAVIQSSSATTVMTVGFVGAGLLSLHQAMGIIFGANIGTTATGWLVSLLGFKLQLGQIAMVALLPAGLANLLGRGWLARVGRIVAGLSLLLVGLDLMQEAVGGVTALASPDSLPAGSSIAGILALALLGLVVTAAIQSSSATVALAMVLLQGGAIDVGQAAVMVIGMNVGTTVTAILAAVGGSAVMRQAAVANLVFNVAVAALALPLLLLVGGVLIRMAGAVGPLNTLLVFHTGFNVVGTAMFLPFTRRFASEVERLFPGVETGWVAPLDFGLLSDPGTALMAAQGAASATARRLFRAFGQALADPPDYRGLSALEPESSRAIGDLEAFLSALRLPEGDHEGEAAYSGLLHSTDHLARLTARGAQKAHIEALLGDRVLRRPALAFGAILRRAASGGPGLDGARLERLAGLVARRANRHRRALLLGEHVGLYSVSFVFAHTNAMRWLERCLHHAARIARYEAGMTAGPRQETPPQA
jgi:phosphate:Na+ symporter